MKFRKPRRHSGSPLLAAIEMKHRRLEIMPGLVPF
jgi:hypothetical protein